MATNDKAPLSNLDLQRIKEGATNRGFAYGPDAIRMAEELLARREAEQRSAAAQQLHSELVVQSRCPKMCKLSTGEEQCCLVAGHAGRCMVAGGD